MERDGDNGEEKAGKHALRGRTGGLECRQGGEVESQGKVVEVGNREAGLWWRNWKSTCGQKCV